jgi:hypothetical protein
VAFAAALTLGLIACEKPEKPIESGRRFVTTVYTDTEVEEFARTDRRILGTIGGRHGDTLRYNAYLGDSGRVQSVLIEASSSRRGERHVFRERFVVPKGSMPILSGSVALWEQMLRRARAVGGDSISIPTVLLGRESTRNVITITSNGLDSVLFTPQTSRPGDGDQLHFAIDSAWRITGGVLPISHTVMVAD